MHQQSFNSITAKQNVKDSAAAYVSRCLKQGLQEFIFHANPTSTMRRN